MPVNDTHPPLKSPRTGVLLISLGTPERPDASAVRSFLQEFLSDPRVVELPRLLWLPLLHGLILPFRPKRSAKAYAKIWNYDTGESPLKMTAVAQAQDLNARLSNDDIIVDWAFTYGSTSIKGQIEQLQSLGCRRILLMALYPQYSATTTAAAYDKAYKALTQMRVQPAVRTIHNYHDHPAYIEALSNSLRDGLQQLNWEPDVIVASYHGIPQRSFNKGDPYPCHARKTSRLVREALELSEDKFATVFQSRFGKAEWVRPYAEETLNELAKSGKRKVVIFAPAFSGDCLETLEEIDIGLRSSFMEAGGTHFHYINCLNASKLGMDMLETIVQENLEGWK